MSIRHAVGVFQDPRQGGDIGHLVENPVIHLRQQFFRCDNAGRNPHSFLERHGKFPDGIGNLDHLGWNSHILTSLATRIGIRWV